MNSTKLIKSLILVFAIVYFVSPVDLIPGVGLDDVLVILASFFLQKRIGTSDGAY